MPYTPEQIKERYNKLPADIKQAMDSVDTTNTIVNIGQKYDLMYDQISELVDEVGLTMIGLTPEARFVSNISRRMQVDIGKAMLIAKDINKEVFDKMRDSLKKIEGVDEEGFSEETMMADAEKAQQKSVISAIEKAGGFVIDKQEDAPLQAEEMVHNAVKEGLESKKDIINILEKKNFEPSTKMTGNPVTPAEAGVLELSQDSCFRRNDRKSENKQIESSLPPDHLLEDVPETSPAPLQQTSIKQTPAQQTTKNNTPTAPKQLDQSSIVDMLLSKGVAMPMDSSTEKSETSPTSQKTEDKKRPYDGTDPYREAVS